MADKDSAPDALEGEDSEKSTTKTAGEVAEDRSEDAESGETAASAGTGVPEGDNQGGAEGSGVGDAVEDTEGASSAEEPARKTTTAKSSKRPAAGTNKSSKQPAAGANKSASRKPEMPSEREINSPNFRTLVMLGSVFIVTVGSWGAARFACNVHTPVNRAPGAQTTAQLSATPKDAAIELYQRWQSLDFDGALELATGTLANRIQKEREECTNNASECAHRRKERSKRLATRGILLSQAGDRATARVQSSLGEKEVAAAQLVLVREGPIWKATETTQD